MDSLSNKDHRNDESPWPRLNNLTASRGNLLSVARQSLNHKKYKVSSLST